MFLPGRISVRQDNEDVSFVGAVAPGGCKQPLVREDHCFIGKRSPGERVDLRFNFFVNGGRIVEFCVGKIEQKFCFYAKEYQAHVSPVGGDIRYVHQGMEGVPQRREGFLFHTLRNVHCHAQIQCDCAGRSWRDDEHKVRGIDTNIFNIWMKYWHKWTIVWFYTLYVLKLIANSACRLPLTIYLPMPLRPFYLHLTCLSTELPTNSSVPVCLCE